MILVTGATGTTGGATLRALVTSGAQVRVGVSHRDLASVAVASGMATTFLRPNGFMQNYLGQARSGAVTPDIEQLLGRPAGAFDDFVARERAAFEG